MNQWFDPTISSSVTPFSSCPPSFPTSGSFPMSWLFILGGQSIGVSASTSVLPMNIQDWFPFGLNGLASLQSKGLLKSLLQHHSLNASVPWHSVFFLVQHSHRRWLLEKPQLWLYRPLSAKWSLCFLICYLVIAIDRRNKRLLISRLQSLSAVILELKKIKSVTASPFPPSICHEVMGLSALT